MQCGRRCSNLMIHLFQCFVYLFFRRLEKFHVMIDSQLAVDTLTAHDPPNSKCWSVFLSVNCGNNRGKIPFFYSRKCVQVFVAFLWIAQVCQATIDRSISQLKPWTLIMSLHNHFRRNYSITTCSCL